MIQLVFSILISILFVTGNGSQIPEKNTDRESYNLWTECKLQNEISFEIFSKAMLGFRQIESLKNKSIITIIDYSKSSSEKRFFVIDIKNKKLLYKCLVSHGKNSGEDYAVNFSNEEGSLKSCLGFFITGETYSGKHGYSLRIDGVEKGINDNARSREIVIHGADYVSQKFIEKYGRLGRSWGCPALPEELAKDIIDVISNGSCLFIYARDKFYNKSSTFPHLSFGFNGY
jgi:hypothetical protein